VTVIGPAPEDCHPVEHQVPPRVSRHVLLVSLVIDQFGQSLVSEPPNDEVTQSPLHGAIRWTDSLGRAYEGVVLGRTAMHSISTRAPKASPLTPKALRAGRFLVK
jgi:hypothetical protein